VAPETQRESAGERESGGGNYQALHRIGSSLEGVKMAAAGSRPLAGSGNSEGGAAAYVCRRGADDELDLAGLDPPTSRVPDRELGQASA